METFSYRRRRARFLGAVLAVLAAGCGNSGTGATNEPPTGGGSLPDMAVPYLTPFPPTAPQVAALAGTVLASPKVVPLFFRNDVFQTSLQTFLQNYITTSTSWKVLKDYGVSAGTVATGTTLTQTLPATMTDADVANMIIQGSGGTIPKADASTLYIIYFPSSVTITHDTYTSCKDFEGYHNFATFPDGSKIPYAVIPRCSRSSLALLTIASSHELAEAASDPVTTSHNQLNDPYGMWLFNLNGAEIGDLCENLSDAAYSETGVGIVNRLWSNTAAAAFKNPCLPAPNNADFFSVPIFSTLKPVQINGRLQNVEMLSLPVGTTKTVPVRLLSSISPSPTWSVSALEVPLPTQSGATGTATLTLSWQEAPGQMQIQGQNGSTLHLQVSAPANAPLGLTTFRLTSTLNLGAAGSTQTMWVGTVEITK